MYELNSNNKDGYKMIDDKKKIAFFIKEGINSFVNDIVNELSSDYEVRFITVTKLNQIDDGMKWADICWFEWCDSITVYGSQLQLARKKKIIVRLHSYEAFTYYITKVEWRNIDKLIFVGNHIKEYVLSKVKTLSTEKTIVIPNGVKTENYHFKNRKPGFNIAYVGYINFKKGPMLLLHTFEAIYKKDNRYKLYIAGIFQEQRYVLYFEQMIKKMGLENNVFIEGWQKNINKWLEDKNYIISTSVLESQHLSVMEAMAKGIKPIIHNFYGAEGIYNSKYIWNTIQEAVEMVESNEYNSDEYQFVIKDKYAHQVTMGVIKDLLKGLLSSSEVAPNNFDYVTYWNERLDKKFDIEGVGYYGMGKIYNYYMYQIRLDILVYIIKEIFRDLKNKDVLELGPGIGTFTQYFYNQKIRYYEGIDISKKSVLELSKIYKDFNFIEGDVSNPDIYSNHKFDLIFCANVLQCIQDDNRYINTIKNMAKSIDEDGFIILIEPISIINSNNISSHVEIRDIEYIMNLLDIEDLELVSILPSAFFMNDPVDKNVIEEKADLVQRIFNYISKVFNNNDISDNAKRNLGKWLLTLEKQTLVHNKFGLSEKVLIVKSKSNKQELSDLVIEKTWQTENLKNDFIKLNNALLKDKELKLIIILLYDMINRILSLNDSEKDIYTFIYENNEINFYLPNLNDWIQKIIYDTKNFYEVIMLDDIKERIQVKEVIVDIGANIGNHTVYFAKICNAKKVYCFEPEKSTFRILQKNIEINNIEDQVKLFNMALGCEKGNGSIKIVNKDNMGMTQVDSSTSGEVTIDTLDHVLKNRKEKINLLKIDVEGMAIEVLQGAVKTINDDKPLIYIEAGTEEEFKQMSEFLKKYQYRPMYRFNATPTYLFVAE